MCVGALAPFPERWLFQTWPVQIWASRSFLFSRVFGRNHTPTPIAKMYLGPRRREDAGNACPWQPFTRPLPPCGPLFGWQNFGHGWGRLELGLPLLARHVPWGSTWIPPGFPQAERRNTCTLEVNCFPVWPYPACSVWHSSPDPLGTHYHTPGTREEGRFCFFSAGILLLHKAF